MTNSPRLVCLGYGYTAAALGRRLMAAGWAVSGTTRNPARMAAIAATGAEPVLWSADGLSPDRVAEAEAILISAAPVASGGDAPGANASRDNASGDAGSSCPALPLLQSGPPPKPLRWIGYLSTNGVYGDHDGAWVDEWAALKATSPRAKARIRAEADWTAWAHAYEAPLVIFRLPGIYGPGRSSFDAIRAGRAQRILKEGQVFSRAHVDDIAAALESSINDPGAGGLFNIADDEPAPPQDVVAYACELLGAPAPPLVPIAEAELSEMARSFYDDNKRVSNALARARLGFSPQFPTYREGLRAILAAGG